MKYISTVFYLFIAIPMFSQEVKVIVVNELKDELNRVLLLDDPDANNGYPWSMRRGPEVFRPPWSMHPGRATGNGMKE